MPNAINDSSKRLTRGRYLPARTLLTAVLTILLAACSGMPRLPDTGSTEALAYQAHCGACHGLPHPHRHTFAQWEHLLALMEVRISERGMNPLSADDRNAILRYLKDNARAD